jgi:hypothetical protein
MAYNAAAPNIGDDDATTAHVGIAAADVVDTAPSAVTPGTAALVVDDYAVADDVVAIDVAAADDAEQVLVTFHLLREYCARPIMWYWKP